MIGVNGDVFTLRWRDYPHEGTSCGVGPSSRCCPPDGALISSTRAAPAQVAVFLNRRVP